MPVAARTDQPYGADVLDRVGELLLYDSRYDPDWRGSLIGKGKKGNLGQCKEMEVPLSWFSPNCSGKKTQMEALKRQQVRLIMLIVLCAAVLLFSFAHASLL